MARSIVRDVRIDEVSFCPQGIHKGARVMLIKAKGARSDPEAQLERFAKAMPADLREALAQAIDKAKPEAVEKMHAELAKAEVLYEPPTFDEIEARRIAQQAADELRERMDSLRQALLEVVWTTDLPDREERIKESINQFVAAMEVDLSAILQGRLVKGQTDRVTGKERSMPATLDKSKLPDEVKSHIEDLESKLAKAAEDLKKAQERAEQAESEIAELRKAKTIDPDSDEGFAELIKGMPPAQAEFLKAERAKRKELEGAVQKMREDARKATFIEKAKGYTHLPGKPEELAEALRKADDAGVLDLIEKALKAANAAMEKAGLTKAAGSDGDGVAAGDEVMAQVEAAAAEIRKAKPQLTKEQAIAEAINQNPVLYKAYMQAHPAPRAN